MTDSKILIWDLECTSLFSDDGTTLCIGWKWLHDEDVHVISIRDWKGWGKTPASLLDDSRVWKEFAKVYEQADLHITYNGVLFDRPMLYAKYLRHGIEIPANHPSTDLYFTAKSNLRLTRKSMDNVTKYLLLQDEEIHKTKVDWSIWRLAAVGDKDSLKQIEDHCYADILLTERLYFKLRPLIRTHPIVGRFGDCRACGSNKLERRGYRLTTTQGRQIRTQCQGCGSWNSFSEAAYLTKVAPGLA